MQPVGIIIFAAVMATLGMSLAHLLLALVLSELYMLTHRP